MAEKSRNISKPVKGMMRNGASYEMSQDSYSFAKNAAYQDSNGNFLNLTNEHSNLLANRFVEGYKVVGFENDLNSDNTFFFLTNPETGCSEFGMIASNRIPPSYLDDGDSTECKDCNFKIDLAEPLEEQEQTPHQEYITLLEDCCNGCLNLSIYHPIKKIVIKDEKCGKSLYFTDGYNPPRYIQLDDLEQYTKITQVEDCSEEHTAEIDPVEHIEYTCPDGFILDSQTNTCTQSTTTDSCPEGYTYNSQTGLCDGPPIIIDACPSGYTYNPSTGMCDLEGQCDSDIAIVMDYSNSVDSTERLEMEQFVKDIVSGLSTELSEDRVRVSIIKFADTSQVMTSLTNNIATINSAIDNNPSVGTETNVNEGLITGDTELNGGRVGVEKMLLLICDGLQNVDCGPAGTPCPSDTYPISTDIKSNGTTITLVALGNETERNEVLNGYGGANSGNTNPDYPVPSPGNGLYGYATYESEFGTASNIVNDVQQAISCTESINNQCNDCVDNQDGTCSCENEIEPDCGTCNDNNDGTCTCTQTQPADENIFYTCNLGTLNTETNKCEYAYTTENDCGCTTEIDTCLDCDKLRIFPLHEDFKITPEQIVLGGRLRLGEYEFIGAYSDNLGNELTEYISLTNSISIFDPNNTILEQQNLDDRTNFAIKLNVESLDDRFTHYKIICIQTTSLDNATRYFVEGVHPISDNTILYTSEENKIEASSSEIFVTKPNVTTWEGITTANDYLLGYGIESEKEWNLQPVVNLLGSFLRWQTHIAKEDLYEDGISTSLYKGYHRDETYPFSIRFHTNTGYKTALFPFIGRPATDFDREEISSTNNDRKSIEANLAACNFSERKERWQLYNTAEELGECPLSEEINTVELTETVDKITIISNIATAPAGFFCIPGNEQFTTLADFIEDKTDFCDEEVDVCSEELYPFCFYLDVDNFPEDNPPIQDEGCTTPVKQGELMLVNEVDPEATIVNIYIDDLDEYERIKTSANGVEIHRLWTQDGPAPEDQQSQGDHKAGDPIHDTDNPFNEECLVLYERDLLTGNIDCASSSNLQHITDVTNAYTPPYFFDYLIGSESIPDGGTPDELLTSQDSTNPTLNVNCVDIDADGNGFYDKIHKRSLWFKKELEIIEEPFILELTKRSKDQHNYGNLDPNYRPPELVSFVRMSIYTACRSKPIWCRIVDTREGSMDVISIYDPNKFKEEDDDTIYYRELLINGENKGVIPNEEIYISLETPVINIQVPFPCDSVDPRRFALLGENAFFSLVTRDMLLDHKRVNYSYITFDKRQTWSMSCTSEIPIVPDCGAVPYKFGKFSYIESTETYSDNEELYNSQNLQIESLDIPTSYQSEFEQNYVDTVNDGEYELSEEANFKCKPIRHFKFPDNKVSPFMYERRQSQFIESLIYPVGITIDETLINSFLDIATKNNLITQEQRDSIISYEIFRGDRTLDKSIVAKGLLYDMRNYEEGNKEIWYSNYPYNDLGNDVLNYASQNQEGQSPILHPYGGGMNNNFTFHSPETDYQRPTLPSEIKVEGYMFGNSRGNFVDVEDHPKWVILGSRAFRQASRLATAEVSAEAALNIAMSASGNTLIFGGVVVGGTWPGLVAWIIAAGFQVASALIYKYARYKYEWLTTFRDLGQPKNFAYYYTSEGFYNYFRTISEEGDELRNMSIRKYMKPSKTIYTDEIYGRRIEINNIDRENSVFISTGDIPIEYPIEYENYDNNEIDINNSSLSYAGQLGACSEGRSPDLIKNIASPYVTLKNYNSSQYGTIDSVKWITTSYKGDLTKSKQECLPIFGGDVFISRHTLKRKIPLFLSDAIGLASLTPFNYRFYSNIGTGVRFWANYEAVDQLNLDRNMPTISYEYNFDCLKGNKDFYLDPPTKFYLYYYGIPSFLCETEINTNYRYGKVDPKNNFYPNVGDFVEWTQERNVSIKEPNRFFYNSIYSKVTTRTIQRTLPSFYNAEDFDCRYDKPNGFMWSLPDNSENDLVDPWLIFRPLDIFEFPHEYGKLRELRGIENEMVLGRFDHQTAVFNAVDALIDDGQSPDASNLGTGMRRRPVTFADTDLGYAGSQTSEMSSNEYGHFYPDAMRGQVFKIQSAAGGIEEISKYSNGQPNGMYNWFKENLPFKILDPRIENYKEINTDNAYNGIGISMGWDARFNRVFLTKKDYKPKQQLYYSDNRYYVDEELIEEVQLTDDAYFEDVSFTIAYYPLTGSWISYYDYKPNYYINHNQYFQTGINQTSDDSEFGLWSHLLTSKSYQVFYGKKYPFILEYPIKNTFTSKILDNIQVWTEVKHYHNKWDFSYNRDIFFNRIWVYNNRENSGELHLVPHKTLSQLRKYPISNGTYQQILTTNTDDHWNINYIFNRVKSEKNNLPLWKWDENKIDKEINNQAISFKGKRTLERMRGDWFNVRLYYDTDSRYDVMFKWGNNTEEPNL